MNPLLESLIEEIEEHGPIPFARYMERALYDPSHGYYATAARTGWSGHYVTSPEIDPGFGMLWAKAIEEIWIACGSPSTFRVVELGPGEGGLAEGLREGLARGPLAELYSHVLVERTPAGTERQRARLGTPPSLSWVSDITELDPAPGVVIAHEVLDNVPVHLVVNEGGRVLEQRVDADGDSLMLTSVPPHPTISAEATELGLEPGMHAEVSPQRRALARACVELVDPGAAIFIDYGLPDGSRRDHPAGTVACYSRSGVDDRPLEDPGTKDITAHVDWPAIAHALQGAGAQVAGPFTQRTILTALGIEELHAGLKEAHDRAIRERAGADALRALSRRQALGTLTDRSGLGGLHVMIGTVGAGAPAFVSGETARAATR